MNKQNVRGVAVIACLLLLAPLAVWAGGSREGSATKPVSISFYYPVGVAGPLATIIGGYVTHFNNTHPSIHVKAVFAGSYTESYSKVLAAIRGGDAPDSAILLSQNLNDLLQQNAIIPLDSFINADPKAVNMSDFFPAFLLNAKENGHIWSLPYQRSTPVMFYNKDAFTKAGLDPNKPPTTWSEVISDGQKLTVRDSSGNVTQWGVEIPSSGGVDTWLLEALTIEAGGLLYNANDSCCTIYLNDPPAKAALTYLRDLGTKYKVSPPGPVNWGTAANDFAAGKVAMLYHSTGSLAYIRHNAKFQWGTAFLPKDKRFGVPTGGGDLYLFKGTPSARQKAAWQFTLWMTSTNQLARWSIDSGYVAPRISSWETPLMKQYVEKYPQALTARDQLKYAHAELPVRNIIEVKRQIVTAMQAVLTSNQSIDSIVAPAQARIDQILKQ